MIFMTALMRGMVSQMLSDGISALPGHVQAHDPDYRDDPSIANLIPLSDTKLQASLAEAGFAGWATRVRVPAVITSEYDSRGVTLLGVDPQHERDLTAPNYVDALLQRGFAYHALGRRQEARKDTEYRSRQAHCPDEPGSR